MEMQHGKNRERGGLGRGGRAGSRRWPGERSQAGRGRQHLRCCWDAWSTKPRRRRRHAGRPGRSFGPGSGDLGREFRVATGCRSCGAARARWASSRLGRAPVLLCESVRRHSDCRGRAGCQVRLQRRVHQCTPSCVMLGKPGAQCVGTFVQAGVAAREPWGSGPRPGGARGMEFGSPVGPPRRKRRGDTVDETAPRRTAT